MISPIEFITRGVKIMGKLKATVKQTAKIYKESDKKARKRVGPVISGTPSKGSAGSFKGPGKTGSTKRVQQRRKTTTARVAKKTTPKKTPVKKTVAKKTTPRKLPGRFGKIAAIGTALGAGALALMRKKDPTFGVTFKKARKEKGPMSTFNYKGKKYSTVTKDQVEKAGHSTLRSYLNAGGKKKTATRPKSRKTGPRNRR